MNRYALAAAVIAVPVIAVGVVVTQAPQPPAVVVTTEQAVAAARVIRANGYECGTVSKMDNVIPGRRYMVKCDGRYLYTITDKGGRWIAEVL